jgi:hypothetical protein
MARCSPSSLPRRSLGLRRSYSPSQCSAGMGSSLRGLAAHCGLRTWLGIAAFPVKTSRPLGLLFFDFRRSIFSPSTLVLVKTAQRMSRFASASKGSELAAQQNVWRSTSSAGKRRRGRPVKAFSEEYRRQICPRRLVVQPRAHQRHWLDDSKAILEAPTEKV